VDCVPVCLCLCLVIRSHNETNKKVKATGRQFLPQAVLWCLPCDVVVWGLPQSTLATINESMNESMNESINQNQSTSQSGNKQGDEVGAGGRLCLMRALV
jgi:hypothetical protein